MIVLIDHRDSFSWNLAHQLEQVSELKVIDYEDCEQIDELDCKLLVFSPGPGNPSEYPKSLETYHKYKTQIPILGICLGFQLILYAENAKIERQNKVMHGVQTLLEINADSFLWKNIERPIKIGRYHSLQVESKSFPKDFILTGSDPQTQVPLAFQHKNYPIYGLQFHPDSILTPYGSNMIQNIGELLA